MTKRAWIIIGILILIPLLVTGIVFIKWKLDNPVVAAYGDTLDELHYGEKTLYAVEGVGDYMAEPGYFLGKVQSALTGAALYTVKYDKTGEMWALVTEKGTVLYTATGKLPSSAYGGKAVSAIFFDDFAHRTTERAQVVLIHALTESTEAPATWLPSEKNVPVRYRMHLCYDDSAVSTVSPGTLLYFPETGLWYFLPDAEEQAVQTRVEDGELSAEKATYQVLPVTDRATIKLLKALLRKGDTSAVVLPSPAVTTASSSSRKVPSAAVESGAVASGAMQEEY